MNLIEANSPDVVVASRSEKMSYVLELKTDSKLFEMTVRMEVRLPKPSSHLLEGEFAPSRLA